MPQPKPVIDVSQLRVWDEQRQRCGGFLYKKAGSKAAKGMFNRGKWQKRWFFIECNIHDYENYVLMYSGSPEEKSARDVIPLEGAQLVINAEVSDYFQISLKIKGRQGMYVLGAESRDTRDAWADTLEYVISIANSRGMSTATVDMPRVSVESDGAPVSVPTTSRKQLPTLRLEIDITTMPPGSPQRLRFEEDFADDLSKILGIRADWVRVHTLRPATGADWMLEVVFQIEADAQTDVSQIYAFLDKKIKNHQPDLFNGKVTCTLDPSFSRNLTSEEVAVTDVYSPDSRVRDILRAYADVPLTDNAIDTSRFLIWLYSDGRSIPVAVMNPRVLPDKDCMLWKHEVKAAIGLLGTIRELWTDVQALRPKANAQQTGAPIPFSPSARHEGLEAIAASKLKPGWTYEVELVELRGSLLEELTPEERSQIEEQFRMFDVNGDGVITFQEYETVCQRRHEERRALIDEQYELLIQNHSGPDGLAHAQEYREASRQQLNEAYNRLMDMFQAMDVDGNQQLSKEEFMLAEAWWMKCTINPTGAVLF